MNKILKFALTSGFLVLSGCASEPAPEPTIAATSEQKTEETIMQHKTITAVEAKKIMDSKADYVLVDVRNADEYAESHIKGAVLIPLDTLSQDAAKKLTDKSRKILVYCRSGRRSSAAATQLAALGYSDVNDFGGIQDWPFEVEK